MDVPVPGIIVRLDSGDDRRVDKEEFTSENMKSTLEKVTKFILDTLHCLRSTLYVWLLSHHCTIQYL